MNVNDILKRYVRLKSERDGYWLNLWRNVRKYCMPSYCDFGSEGTERGADVFTNCPIDARARLAAGLHSWMFTPNQRNYELGSDIEDNQQTAEIKDFFAKATNVTMMVTANSNFHGELNKFLNNIACGLDGVMFCEERDDDDMIVFKSFPIETICYQENSAGRVDTVFRELTMTARQLAEDFKSAKMLPQSILDEANNPEKMDSKHAVLHAVFARKERDPKMLDNKNMPFADIYILIKEQTIIFESGYHEFPYAVCRFYKNDNETYGRGPGIDQLPGIRQLNRMEQAYIIGMEYAAFNNWLLPDGSLIGKDFDNTPGAVIRYKVEINGIKPEVVRNVGDIHSLDVAIKDKEAKIERGFFNDIFDPLGDLKQITATEAEIRNAGKMVPFAPIAGNIHNEFYKPIIHRIFSICARRGLLGEIPLAVLQNPGYKVDFVSKIALSLKKLESLGWLQTEAALAGMAANNPAILDNFDQDKIARDVAAVNGSSPQWLVPIAERDQMRAARNQQMAQQQQLAMLAEGAKAAPGLSQAPEPGSPLASVLSGTGV